MSGLLGVGSVAAGRNRFRPNDHERFHASDEVKFVLSPRRLVVKSLSQNWLSPAGEIAVLV
jgi:hypothetical protein